MGLGVPIKRLSVPPSHDQLGAIPDRANDGLVADRPSPRVPRGYASGEDQEVSRSRVSIYRIPMRNDLFATVGDKNEIQNDQIEGPWWTSFGRKTKNDRLDFLWRFLPTARSPNLLSSPFLGFGGFFSNFTTRRGIG